MPSTLTGPSRARALAGLKEAEVYLARQHEPATDEARSLVEVLKSEVRTAIQTADARYLALVSDEFTPVKLFAPWASDSRFQQWRDDPKIKLDVRVIHGRLCVKPSEFFALWRKLPSRKKAR